MTILSARDRKAALAVFCLASSFGGVNAFVHKPSPLSRTAVGTGSAMEFQALATPVTAITPSLNSFLTRHHWKNTPGKTRTSLNMADADFDQMQYTEAAWAVVSGLSQAAEYYEASNVEAPLLLEILLNPRKHNAGENAEAAERAVKTVLNDAGVDIKELRQGLEQHLSGRPRVKGGGGQKVLGRDTPKVLESARAIMSVLGVRLLFQLLREIST